ncbi:hypothetical protein P9G84_10105 [Brevibacillus centrosporus]|nr:hypothetical protein [Brevibacillus centrosporus]MEC2129320.1 hypothetical protein [Brevibacillus centrosporus]GED33486.1 hypothetical protein BCE02nite_46270 [Brevibacillus centrosporus]
MTDKPMRQYERNFQFSNTNDGETFTFALYGAMDNVLEAACLIKSPELNEILMDIYYRLNDLTVDCDSYEEKYDEQLYQEQIEHAKKIRLAINEVANLHQQYRAIRGQGTGGPRSRPTSKHHDEYGIFSKQLDKRRKDGDGD